MSVTINLPPELEEKAQGYTMLKGKTLEQMFLDYLEGEIRRQSKADTLLSKLDRLVEQSHGRLAAPYKFNRADAYEPEVAFA